MPPKRSSTIIRHETIIGGRPTVIIKKDNWERSREDQQKATTDAFRKKEGLKKNSTGTGGIEGGNGPTA